MNIERAEKLLKDETKKLESLLTLKSSVERLENMKQKEVPDLKVAIAELDKKLASAQSEKVRLEKALDEPTTKIETINSISGDMTLLDEAIKETQRINTDLISRRSYLPEGRSELTMEDAQRQRKAIGEKLKAKNVEIDKNQTQYDEKSDMTNKLHGKLNARKGEKIKLQEEVQMLVQLKNRREEIVKQIAEFEDVVKKLEEKIQPLSRSLKEAIDRKQRCKQANTEKLRTAQMRLTNLKQFVTEVKRNTEEIRKLAEEKLEDAIQKCEIKLKKLGEDAKAQVCKSLL